MRKFLDFVTLAVAGSVIIYVLSLIFKSAVILGNDKVVPILAAIYAGIILAIVAILTPVVVSNSPYRKIKNQSFWLVIYFIVNFVAVWIIKRFAFITGVGMVSDIYVLLAALLLSGAGWVVLRRH